MAYEKKIKGDGTSLSGFVGAEENQLPRKCGNCIWYKHDKCHHPVVQIDPSVPGEEGKPKPVTDDDCCNFFQSPGKTLVYGLRHGTTDLNTGNKFRGWLDVKLDSKGKKDAEDAAEFLKGKGIKMVYCSDLDRAVETANIVCKALDLGEPWQDYRLRPWNMGKLAGKDRDEHKEELEEYIDNPDWEIPEGESLYQFSDRVRQALEFYLHEAREEGIKLLVFHTSNVIQMDELCKGKNGTGRPEADEIVKPGGVIKISEKKDKLSCEAVFKEKENTSEIKYGS